MKVSKKKLDAIINKAKKQKKTDKASEYNNKNNNLLIEKIHYSEDFIIRNRE